MLLSFREKNCIFISMLAIGYVRKHFTFSCYSELGRKWEKGKATFVSLGPSCWKKDIVLHMILHALGKLGIFCILSWDCLLLKSHSNYLDIVE